jgi:ornithine carrier protein
MAENASLFLAYEQFKSLIRNTILVDSHSSSADEPLPLRYNALAAGGAGAVTSFILTPIELVKCKMQVQMLVTPSSAAVGGAAAAVRAPLPGPISVLLSVIRTTGVKGLWLGHTGTFIRETGGTAAWFGTKEYVAGHLLRRRLRLEGHDGSRPGSKDLLPWESALSGACAGAAFNIALFPADTVKSAMQTEEELRKATTSGEAFKRSTFLGTFKKMYKAQGVRGLYAGCGITVARSIPSSAIIFLTYDELKKTFG